MLRRDIMAGHLSWQRIRCKVYPSSVQPLELLLKLELCSFPQRACELQPARLPLPGHVHVFLLAGRSATAKLLQKLIMPRVWSFSLCGFPFHSPTPLSLFIELFPYLYLSLAVPHRQTDRHTHTYTHTHTCTVLSLVFTLSCPSFICVFSLFFL